MTQEDKQLLLTDICARLPYGVKVENTSFSEPQIHTLFGRVSDDEFLMLETYKSVGGEDYRRVTNDVHYTGYLVNIKPYLRPLSSMTKNEKKELGNYVAAEMFASQDKDPLFQLTRKSLFANFFNKHHIDYIGLIPMGLALEAPEGMYKFN